MTATDGGPPGGGGPWVYFIQAGEGGPIKIGFTTGSPAARLASLQTGNPYPLKLIAAVRGAVEVETELHGRFGHLRMVGEWFRPAADLTAFIAGVQWSAGIKPIAGDALPVKEDAPGDIDPAPKLGCPECEDRRRAARSIQVWEASVIRAATVAFVGDDTCNGLQAESAITLRALSDGIHSLSYAKGIDHRTLGLVRAVITAISERPR